MHAPPVASSVTLNSLPHPFTNTPMPPPLHHPHTRTCSRAMCLSLPTSKNCRFACSAGSTKCPLFPSLFRSHPPSLFQSAPHLTPPQLTCSRAMCLSLPTSKNCRFACSAGSTKCPVSGCTTTPAGLLAAAEQQAPYPAAASAAAGGGGRRPWMEASTRSVAVLIKRAVLSL